MLLELNARPGLNIQLANRCGLRPRLALVERGTTGAPVEERVAFAMNTLAAASAELTGD